MASRVVSGSIYRIATLGLLGLLSFPCLATPPTIWPNLSGMGTCTTTLQACIYSVSPDTTILIGADEAVSPDSYTRVDESITIDRSLTLAAADGIDAVFSNGRSIIVNSPSVGPVTITLSRLVLTRGHVLVTHNSDTDSFYSLDKMVFNGTDAVASESVVYFQGSGTGIPTYTVADSRLDILATPGGTAPDGLRAYRFGGPWQVNFIRNRVRSENGSLGVVLGTFTGGGDVTGTVIIDGNQLLGHNFAAGIQISVGSGSSSNSLHVQNNMVVGQRNFGSGFAINVATHQSIVQLVNNTLVGNDSGMYVSSASGMDTTSTGRIANNLIAFNTNSGIQIATTLSGSSISNDYNLVYGNPANAFNPGVNTMVFDPLLISRWNPRLTASSPARDAGNNADAPSGAPSFDGDGELRIVNSTVDIGAFEVNHDATVVHDSTALNTSGDRTTVGALASLANTANLLIAPQHSESVALSEMIANLGVFFGTQWTIRREDGGALSTERRFNILAPVDGRVSYVHDALMSNVTGASTLLDNAALNNEPTAIAFITHNYDPSGSPSATSDHRIGLSYQAPNWSIENQDAAAMGTNLHFNVAVAPANSPNAFTYTSPTSAVEIRLAHPLLDGNDCAVPIVTRNASLGGISDDTAHSLRYIPGSHRGVPGHWAIRAEGGGIAAFPANAGFNVMVHGAQAQTCRDDRLFIDGYED